MTELPGNRPETNVKCRVLHFLYAKKVLGVFLLTIVIGFGISLFVPPLHNFLYSGYFRMDDFSENFYSTTNCENGQIDLSLLVKFGTGSADFTNASYQFWHSKNEQKTLLHQTSNFASDESIDGELIPIKTYMISKDNGGYPQINIRVPSDKYNESNFIEIAKCIEENIKEINSALQTKNKSLPETDIVFIEPEIGAVYLY